MAGCIAVAAACGGGDGDGDDDGGETGTSDVPAPATTEPAAGDEAAVRPFIQEPLSAWDESMTDVLADPWLVADDPDHELVGELARSFTDDSPFVEDLSELLGGYVAQDAGLSPRRPGRHPEHDLAALHVDVGRRPCVVRVLLLLRRRAVPVVERRGATSGGRRHAGGRRCCTGRRRLTAPRPSPARRPERARGNAGSLPWSGRRGKVAGKVHEAAATGAAVVALAVLVTTGVAAGRKAATQGLSMRARLDTHWCLDNEQPGDVATPPTQQALHRHGMVGSMGHVGYAGDNAAMESFFALLQRLLHHVYGLSTMNSGRGSPDLPSHPHTPPRREAP